MEETKDTYFEYGLVNAANRKMWENGTKIFLNRRIENKTDFSC
jgi:hypothetical protein